MAGDMRVVVAKPLLSCAIQSPEMYLRTVSEVTPRVETQYVTYKASCRLSNGKAMETPVAVWQDKRWRVAVKYPDQVPRVTDELRADTADAWNVASVWSWVPTGAEGKDGTRNIPAEEEYLAVPGRSGGVIL